MKIVGYNNLILSIPTLDCENILYEQWQKDFCSFWPERKESHHEPNVLRPFLVREFYNPVLNRIQMSADEKKTHQILTLMSQLK